MPGVLYFSLFKLSFFFKNVNDLQFFLYSSVFFKSLCISPLVFFLLSLESIISVFSIYSTLLRIRTLDRVLSHFPLGFSPRGKLSQFLDRKSWDLEFSGFEQVLLGNE